MQVGRQRYINKIKLLVFQHVIHVGVQAIRRKVMLSRLDCSAYIADSVRASELSLINIADGHQLDRIPLSHQASVPIEVHLTHTAEANYSDPKH